MCSTFSSDAPPFLLNQDTASNLYHEWKQRSPSTRDMKSTQLHLRSNSSSPSLGFFPGSSSASESPLALPSSPDSLSFAFFLFWPLAPAFLPRDLFLGPLVLLLSALSADLSASSAASSSSFAFAMSSRVISRKPRSGKFSGRGMSWLSNIGFKMTRPLSVLTTRRSTKSFPTHSSDVIMLTLAKPFVNENLGYVSLAELRKPPSISSTRMSSCARRLLPSLSIASFVAYISRPDWNACMRSVGFAPHIFLGSKPNLMHRARKAFLMGWNPLLRKRAWRFLTIPCAISTSGLVGCWMRWSLSRTSSGVIWENAKQWPRVGCVYSSRWATSSGRVLSCWSLGPIS